MMVVPAYSTSGNIIANEDLLKALIIGADPSTLGIFMDASIELELFRDAKGLPPDKDKFLYTDLDEAESKILKPILAKMEAEKLEKEREMNSANELKELRSYKKKTEPLLKEKNLKIEELAEKLAEIITENEKLESSNKELQDSIATLGKRMESMRNEFNRACKQFKITRDENGNWYQY
jgi:DNA repair exonuclease SbcCD ATPase subunit